ncbi:hypothetical protein [Chlamydia vaughanii]|uniref:hypothetical protein n=1 Tax=Chlamydia vaughanii TaxID=3112552 RepID=UPI0032B2FCF9
MKKIFYIFCLCALLPTHTLFTIEDNQQETEAIPSHPTVCPFYILEANLLVINND